MTAGDWVPRFSHTIDDEPPILVQLQTKERTRFEFDENNLNINEKVYQTKIFEEEEEEAEIYKIDCDNYRKLAWSTGVDFQGAYNDKPTTKASPKNGRNAGRGMSIVVKSVQETIDRIHMENACKVNVGAKMIINTGGEAPQHARDMRILLGSSCLFFNHPGYLRSAGNVIQSLHNSNYMTAIDARQSMEDTRMVRMMISGNIHSQPTFCEQPDRTPKLPMPQNRPLARRHSFSIVPGSAIGDTKLATKKDTEPVTDAYRNAESFLNSHLVSLNSRNTVNAKPVPLKTPQNYVIPEE